MDDKSPAYENFMNKMTAMNSGPKINVTTIKFGGLEKRVATVSYTHLTLPTKRIV